MPRSVFDFRDDDMRGPQYRTPAQAPSATATVLRDQTQRALAPRGNTLDNVFSHPDPYPTQQSATAPRSGGNNMYSVGNPNGPAEQARKRAASLFEDARSARGRDRQSYYRQAMEEYGYAGGVRDAATTENASIRRDRTDRANALLTNTTDERINARRDTTTRDMGFLQSDDQRYGIDVRDARSASNAELTARTSRENTVDRVLEDADAAKATDDYRRARLQNMGGGRYGVKEHMASMAQGAYQPGSAEEQRSFNAMLFSARTPEERAQIEQFIEEAGAASVVRNAEGGLVTAYAEGGIVAPQPGGAYPALGPASPRLPDPQLISRYQQYADGARALGLSTVGFEEFAAMSQGAGATAGGAAGAPVAMAEGGEVPGAAGGRMVFDADPNAPTDSIPAVIDGETPAALDSGEFVFPRHAVLYYGTDKLNKMVAKSAQAQEGGDNGKSATGVNG